VKYFTEKYEMEDSMVSMTTLKTKAYVQLIPSVETEQIIKAIQNDIPELQSKTKLDTLHVTVLHVGIADRLYKEIKQFVRIEEAAFLGSLYKLILELEHIVKPYDSIKIKLTSNAVTLFGENQSIVVLSLKPTAELIHLHTKCLNAYTHFLLDCGIEDVDIFLKSSRVIAHSDTLTPHVSLGRIGTRSFQIDHTPTLLSFTLDTITK
jgi:hypothetical protein